MMEFLQSNEFLVPAIGGLKAFAVCMFGLNIGVILTWVERRVRGMIQDCIGPNRAGIPMPGKVAAGALAAGPGLSAAGAVLGLAVLLNYLEVEQSGWGVFFIHFGLFATWLILAALARAIRNSGAQNEAERFIRSLGSPRGIALTGIGAHVSVAALGIMAQGTAYEADYVLATYWGGSLLFALIVSAGAMHVAAGFAKQDTVRLRVLGLLHPMADGLKTAFKADFIPEKGDKLLYNLAPWITLLPALVLLAIVPFGPSLCFGELNGIADLADFQGIEAAGHRCEAASISMQVADLNVGILYFFAIAGTGIVGAALAGWASDNKFSLLGGMRAASQMVSYEVTLGLTVVGAIMVYGSVQVGEMVLWQAENAWGIFVQPLAFFLFIAAAIAETKRVPFDLPEGESELVAGYFTEYAGMKFAMFFFSEFIAVVSSSTIMAALFFGGWHLPFVTAGGIEVIVGATTYYTTELPAELLAIIGVLGFVGKVVALCLLQVFIRWTLPRFRYDQLMRLGWRKLLPASLFNVMATATIMLALDSGSDRVKEAAEFVGQLTMVLLAGGGVALAVAFVVFLFVPPAQKQRMIVSTAARYTERLGGTVETQMEA